MLPLLLMLSNPVLAESYESTMETRIPNRMLRVYRHPTSRSNVRGRLVSGAAFYVIERVEGEGCNGSEGWGLIGEDAYVCLDQTQPTTARPVPQPELVTFDHPEPDEYWDYLKTGQYKREPISESDALVPFVYAKRWRTWTGPLWSNLESWNRGDRARSSLKSTRKYHFIEAIDTNRGTVLSRSNGQVVPADDVFIYPISRFQGRDLRVHPIDDDRLPAWVFGYDGGPVYASPHATGEPVLVLEYHQPLEVMAQAASEDGHWWEIPDALGPGIPGYANDQIAIRHWVPRTTPEEIQDDELWIDVDRDQQVLALLRGDELLFVTMVSTGASHYYRTRSGTYRIMDKSIYGDMVSREDAEDQYHVEKVPWVMHFYPRYAIHGVFWHWGFGNPASHGCINMSPRDAKYIFDRVYPQLPNGWHTVYETPTDPGMLLRVRRGDEVIPDKRKPIRDDRSAAR